MAKHEIEASLPEVEVKNKDAEFAISRDGSKLGTLKISRGTIEWVPANNSYGHHLNWVDFDELMRDHGDK